MRQALADKQNEKKKLKWSSKRDYFCWYGETEI